MAPQYKGGCDACAGDHRFADCPWSQTPCINPKCHSTKADEGVEEVDGCVTFLLGAVEEDGAVSLPFFWEQAEEVDGVVAAALPFDNGGTSADFFDADVDAVFGANKVFLIFFVGAAVIQNSSPLTEHSILTPFFLGLDPTGGP
ncbi:hypothetical protein C5167_024088 [Papaver somniferum]|uniref:Uncharacterized protein n=1 Tax=Papaver somniferum TaxID=3469 RepID=A0A4Y7JRG2_PAPSO|nr:hypothetical protein C5167_024088 [Papaver somniferum]